MTSCLIESLSGGLYFFYILWQTQLSWYVFVVIISVYLKQFAQICALTVKPAIINEDQRSYFELTKGNNHDDFIKWKHFPRYWRFVRGIHRSPVNSLHKGQWCGALMFSLICVWINSWVNNREAGDLRCYRAHYDVIVIMQSCADFWFLWKQ